MTDVDLNKFRTTEEEKTEYETLPEGQYNVLIESALIDGNTGKISWTFKILEGKYQNRKIWRTTPLSGKGAYYTNQILKPFNKKLPEDLNTLPEMLSPVCGRGVLLYVTHSKFKSERNPDKVFYDVKVDGLLEHIQSDQIPF